MKDLVLILSVSDLRRSLSLLIILALALCLVSCDENKRFEIGYADSIAPSPPVYVDYKPLYGGAIIYFIAPEDEDLLSIDATYLNKEGQEVWFSVSYFTDSINVLGFSDTIPQKVQLFATDRAGNRSNKVDVTVTPLQSAVSQVMDKLTVKAGFSSLIVDWENEQLTPVNIFVDYEYVVNGQTKTGYAIFSSNTETGQELIRGDLDASQITQPVKVTVRIEDKYGNTKEKVLEPLSLLVDIKIPKANWSMPNTNDSIAGVPQAFLNASEGRAYMLYDDIIADENTFNWANTGEIGRTGDPKDGNVPFNIMIDLGDYYELSRIVTHQRYCYSGGSEYSGRMEYYYYPNIGIYRMYYWDEDIADWEEISTHKITFPADLPSRAYRLLGRAGDMAYMYPDDPRFTKATRWFRYEALFGFNNDYNDLNPNCLSEITLYGRKAN